MVHAGTDVFHFHRSHRSGGDFERNLPLFRKYATESGKDISCRGDLQGAKFRVAELESDFAPLVIGEAVEFGVRKEDNDHIRPYRNELKLQGCF